MASTSALRAARRAWLGWTDALLVGGAELRLAYSLEPQGRAARLLAAQVRPAIGPPADDRERWGTSGEIA